MRIAFVVHDCSSRFGQGKYVLELAERFVLQHDVHIFASTFSEELPENIVRQRVAALRSNSLSTILSFLGPATHAVTSARPRFDIVHAQGLTTLAFNVMTAHIVSADYFAARRELGDGNTVRQRVFEAAVTPLEHAAFRLSRKSQIIAVSDSVRQSLAKSYGRNTGVSVIHHGVRSDRFQPASPERRAELRTRFGWPSTTPVALFVGDLKKGAACAIAVAARVPELRLALVSTAASEEYRALARTHKLKERVQFLTGSDSVVDYYQAADLFLYPSPYDSFGMVVLEAMACGLPVVTTRRAGVSELVSSESGLLVDSPEDLEPLVSHVQRLVHDAAERSQLGGQARQLALRHNWDTVASETMRVYEAALGQ